MTYYEEYKFNGTEYGIERVKVGNATVYGIVAQGCGPYETRDSPEQCRQLMQHRALKELDQRRDDILAELGRVTKDRAQIELVGISAFLTARNPRQKARRL